MSTHILVIDSGDTSGGAGIRDVLPPWAEVSVIDALSSAHRGDIATRARHHASSVAHGPATALVASCMDTSLALALGGELAASGHLLTGIVLLAPARAGVTDLVDHTALLLTKLGVPADDADRHARDAWLDAPDTPAALAASSAALRTAAASFADDLGLGDDADDFVDDLCERYSEWLAHLASQLDVAGLVVDVPVVAVTADADATSEIVGALSPGVSLACEQSSTPQSYDAAELRELVDRIIGGLGTAPDVAENGR